MAKFGQSDDLRGAEFVEVDLRGARFVESDLSRAVMRGVEVNGADIDSPWVTEPGASLIVNGVDVAGYVEGELNSRFPGRADRRAVDPDGLRAAWACIERTWAAAVERVANMPEGTADISVDGEWSFAQTQRHLIHATDMWFGRAILGREELHPLGLADVSSKEGAQPAPSEPTYSEILEARAGHQTLVRDFLATVTPAELDAPRTNPHGPHPETTRSCLHVILEEEWEHYRFATRDLDKLPT